MPPFFILMLILALLSLYLLISWLKELLFYRRNNWDFSIKHGKKLSWGEDAGGPPMPAKQKLFLGYPFMFGVMFLLFIAYAYAYFYGKR